MFLVKCCRYQDNGPTSPSVLKIQAGGMKGERYQYSSGFVFKSTLQSYRISFQSHQDYVLKAISNTSGYNHLELYEQALRNKDIEVLPHLYKTIQNRSSLMYFVIAKAAHLVMHSPTHCTFELIKFYIKFCKNLIHLKF